MLNVCRSILIISMLSTSFAALAEDYLGLDYKYRWMRGRNTTAATMRQVLPKSYNEAEVYYARRSDSLSYGVGYEQSQNKTQNHSFVAGEHFLKNNQSAGDTSTIRTRLMAIQFNLNGYMFVYKQLEAVGQLGLSLFRANMKGTVTSSGVTTNLAPAKTFGVTPKIGLGLQYIGKYRIGVRGMAQWEGTSTYRLRVTDEDGVRRAIKPFTQSWCFILGIFARI